MPPASSYTVQTEALRCTQNEEGIVCVFLAWFVFLLPAATTCTKPTISRFAGLGCQWVSSGRDESKQQSSKKPFFILHLYQSMEAHLKYFRSHLERIKYKAADQHVSGEASSVWPPSLPVNSSSSFLEELFPFYSDSEHLWELQCVHVKLFKFNRVNKKIDVLSVFYFTVCCKIIQCRQYKKKRVYMSEAFTVYSS